ncbi:alpha/beta fold hydrolase [Streptomyces sp. NPDC058382]|uniref:alpha/beta fold hydrolase n=1 Tax=unclassified Streptomyces TaxID=2593676 RepID=UPI00362C30B9
MTWSEHVVVRDGVRLVCRDRGGPGQPVILLHGLAGHAGEWDTVAEALSPGYRIVAVDQRGHGAAERRPRDVSRTAYVADVVAVAEQLGLRRPVLVGQSLGAHTAMLTAAAHTDLVRALVLVEAGPGMADPNTAAKIGSWIDRWPKPFDSRDAAVRFFGGGPLGEGWAAGLEERADGWWPRFEREVMVGSIAELARRPFWDEWDAVACPTLLALGQDGFIPAQEVDEMLRRRPDTEAACFPNTGHDLHLEQPAALCALISGFLNGIG